MAHDHDPKSPKGDAPRTDLPPRRLPYDEEADDYFGSEEERGVVAERQADQPGQSSGGQRPERQDPT